ncbi:hypothetical protein D3C87_1870560 [compost metagenome]
MKDLVPFTRASSILAIEKLPLVPVKATVPETAVKVLAALVPVITHDKVAVGSSSEEVPKATSTLPPSTNCRGGIVKATLSDSIVGEEVSLSILDDMSPQPASRKIPRMR